MAINPQRVSTDESSSEEAFINTASALASSNRHHFSRAWLRLQRLGIPSIGSLVFGGAVLIFVALNVLVGPMNSTGWNTSRQGYGMSHNVLKYPAQPVRVGSSWSIQVWVAITGVGFGLISHGLREAVEHLFEWWSSRQARSAQGLDYARYLNTQPNSPVTYGVRGFPVFATLRYVVLAASIAMSVGYKFGFRETNVMIRETTDPKISMHPSLYLTDMEMEVDLPWFRDFPCDSETRQFSPIPYTMSENPDPTTMPADEDRVSIESYQEAMSEYPQCSPGAAAPYGMTMASPIDISAGWGGTRSGHIINREMVLFATMEKVEGSGIRMHREEDDGWFRIVSASTAWVNQTGAGVMIEFRLPDPDTVQIQWAEAGQWVTNASSPIDSAPVVSRLTYNMHYGIAEVTRTFFLMGTAGVEARIHNTVNDRYIGPRLLSVDGSPIAIKMRDDSIARRRSWLAGLLSKEDIGIRDGTSAIVRAAMFGWADVYDGSSGIEGNMVRLLTSSDEPFGPENLSSSRRAREFPDLEYPIFNGEGLGATGCYMSATGVFLAIGIMSILVAIIRIWVGPAELTSWTAQHIYLSQIGLLPSFAGSSDLKSGYEVVSPEMLGFFRIKSPLTPSTA